MYDIRKSQRIVVIGCGGAGLDSLHHLSNKKSPYLITIGFDTDSNPNNYLMADHYFPLTKTFIKRQIHENIEDNRKLISNVLKKVLRNILKPNDFIIITAGLGKQTGTYLATLIAEIVKEISNNPVIGLVTYPYPYSKERLECARHGINYLTQALDSVIVFEMERLRHLFKNPDVGTLYSKTSRLIAAEIEFLTSPFINIDNEDFLSVIGTQGIDVVLYGEGSGPDMIQGLVRACLSNPLLDIDYRMASGCLVLVEGGPGLTRNITEKITDELTVELSHGADIAWGFRNLKGLGNKVHGQAIMTGIQSGWPVGIVPGLAPIKNIKNSQTG